MNGMHKDEVIISGIINGDKGIISGFYKENVRFVKHYVLSNSGNEADVYDVFQDAIVILYQKLRDGAARISTSVKTYFYGICKNIWRMRLRSKEKDAYSETDVTNLQATDREHADTSIEVKEREHLYRKHFNTLSVSEQQLLKLFFERKTMQEIAEIMGNSVGYVRKKKFEAKAKLIAKIENDPAYKELKTT